MCSKCGVSRDFGMPIEVHHLDGHPFNNDEDNLIVVCKKCHIEIHGGINRKWGGYLGHDVLIHPSKFPSCYESWKIIFGSFVKLYSDHERSFRYAPFRCSIAIHYPDDDDDDYFFFGQVSRARGQ